MIVHATGAERGSVFNRLMRDGPMPMITHLVETALYADDLERTVAFYRDVIGLRLLSSNPRMAVLDVNHASVLLIFRRGATSSDRQTPEGVIAPHDGQGPAHIAFGNSTDSLNVWEQHLLAHHIVIESRRRADRGGLSLYFRDPAGHSVELATPGQWEVYEVALAVRHSPEHALTARTPWRTGVGVYGCALRLYGRNRRRVFGMGEALARQLRP